MTTDREEYLNNTLPYVPSDALLPSWLQKEAGMEEDWEKVEKMKLELNAFARDFKRAFPAEAFAGIFQTDNRTMEKKQIKSTEEVLGDAYNWLSKKTKGDAKLAKSILDAATLVDEYAGPIMQMFKNAGDDEALDKTEKTIMDQEKPESDLFGPTQPNEALKAQRESETTAESITTDMNDKRLLENREVMKKQNDYLERKRVIAGYGMILNEEKLSLYKKGELLKEINTDDLGGFAVAADEVDSLQSAEDVETLFAAAPSDIVPVETVVVNAQPTQVIATVGNMRLHGYVKAIHANNTCSFLVTEGMNALVGSEIEIPLTSVEKKQEALV